MVSLNPVKYFKSGKADGKAEKTAAGSPKVEVKDTKPEAKTDDKKTEAAGAKETAPAPTGNITVINPGSPAAKPAETPTNSKADGKTEDKKTDKSEDKKPETPKPLDPAVKPNDVKKG